MPQKTHYQDDLFILSVLVKTLDYCLSVEADQELFKEKIFNDIDFIDEKIRLFYSMLAQNSHLIERTEYLKLLDRITKDFLSSINDLVNKVYPCYEPYTDHIPGLIRMTGVLEPLRNDLLQTLKSATDGEIETELVSSDELSELLRI